MIDLIDELRRFSRGDAFDEQPMAGLDSEASDFRVASESFAPVRALSRRDLEDARLPLRRTSGWPCLMSRRQPPARKTAVRHRRIGSDA